MTIGIKLAVCILNHDGQIMSKKCVESEWSQQLEDSLNRTHGIDISKEVACVMWPELLKQMNNDTLHQLIKDASMKDTKNEG